MAQPNEVPRFKGDEEPEEAEKWLEILVESTGSFSDTGIFRLLGMRFPTGSPAQEWFNSLEAGTKASWEAFKQAFHSRWIDTAERIRKQRAWEAFAHHSLSDDTIFSGRDFNYENSCNILRLWAEEHLRLWQKTDSDDEVLVETTKGLLPSFILAYFRAYLQDRQFSNLVELCSEVSSLPSQILLFEHTRRQLASMEKIVSMEKQINVVSEKVDKIMNMISEGGLNISVPSLPGPLNQPSGHLDRSGDPVISSNESIHWEQSSPLTSVASIGDPEATPISEVSTPIAPPILLSNQIEGDQSSLLGPEENIVSGIVVELEPSLQVPREWRKPFRTKSTKELIELARRVMAFATYTRNASGVYYEQFNIFNSAMAVFDRLTESTLRVTGGM
ncbi:hypothetical protein FRC02_006743 [Tulasnella sp. 418]|nr:hypothetical protein FRC02_006743 [Tulasnella sp. 418]